MSTPEALVSNLQRLTSRTSIVKNVEWMRRP